MKSVKLNCIPIKFVRNSSIENSQNKESKQN